MRFRVRTLLILLAVVPPLMAFGWWRYTTWRDKRVVRLLSQETVLFPGDVPWTKATYSDGMFIFLPPGESVPDRWDLPRRNSFDPDSAPPDYYKYQELNPMLPLEKKPVPPIEP